MSIARRLYIVLGIMALLIFVELTALYFTIHTLSAVRAYVGGEGLWSKAEKDAVYHLEAYSRSRDPKEFEAYQSFLSVSLGDREARLEFSKPHPDWNREYHGFVDGRNSAEDVPGMIALFANFGRVSYIAQAIEDWTAADGLMVALQALADQLHHQVLAHMSVQIVDRTTAQIEAVNGELTVVEDHFSSTLGEGSRWLSGLVLSVLWAAALTVELTGLILTIAVTRGISKRLNGMLDVVRRVAHGDFEATIEPSGNDEITRLAVSFNKMTRDIAVERQRTEDAVRVAIENARLYEQEHRVAGAFQRAALPTSLPEVAGLHFDGIYEASKSEERVGGDWYDALRLADGRIVVSIGDVSGSGLDAAVIMAAMRQVIRGVAQIHPDPIVMLDAADRILKAEHNDAIVTAFVGILDPVGSTLTYGSAGHPRPLLRTADGAVNELAANGLPLGLRVRGEASAEHVSLPPDSMLVFYTDGLTESTHDPIEGERLLRELLGSELVLNASPSRTIHDTLLRHGTHDDVAILTVEMVGTGDALRRRGAEVQLRWSFDAHDASAARSARSAFTEALGRRGVRNDAVMAAELVFGELLANVVRYAPGSVEVLLDWSGHDPILHVLDEGPGFALSPRLPTDLLSERGRGLYLAWSLTEEFNVTPRIPRGSHARAVLSIGHRQPMFRERRKAG